MEVTPPEVLVAEFRGEWDYDTTLLLEMAQEALGIYHYDTADPTSLSSMKQ
jgi:hypothetical protein